MPETLESLRAMDPLELDALAMVRVMGWKWHRREDGIREPLCAILPPVPTEWGCVGAWEPAPWAEGMWKPCRGIAIPELRFSDWWRACQKAASESRDWRSSMPRPSQNIADAYELEEALVRRGLRVMLAYRDAVCDVTDGGSVLRLWNLIHASPLQRTLAAVLACQPEETRA